MRKVMIEEIWTDGETGEIFKQRKWEENYYIYKFKKILKRIFWKSMNIFFFPIHCITWILSKDYRKMCKGGAV